MKVTPISLIDVDRLVLDDDFKADCHKLQGHKEIQVQPFNTSINLVDS